MGKVCRLANTLFRPTHVPGSEAVGSWLHGSIQAAVLRLTQQVIHSVDRIDAAAERMLTKSYPSCNPDLRMDGLGWGRYGVPCSALF